MVLPGGREDARQKLAKVEEELRHLEKVHDTADEAAHRVTRRLLVGGGLVLFTQLVAFIYLTWWELSWDVMEPFGYCIQLFYSLLAYTYVRERGSSTIPAYEGGDAYEGGKEGAS